MRKGIFIILVLLCGQVGAEERLSLKERLTVAILGKSGGDRLFYYPTRKQPYTPKKYGYRYEDVEFKSKDGTKLHGWFLPSKLGKAGAKGTIIFSHGNAGSLAHHFGFVYWMVNEGYNVFMYDYRGYGRSGGKVSKKGLVEDAVAGIKYVAARKDIDVGKLISFGHSLGGAKSIAAIAGMGVDLPKGLKGVIVDSTFASYRDMAVHMAGAAGLRVVSASFDPVDSVKEMRGVELLVIHGTRDRTVPLQQGEKLFKAAREPKTFFKVNGGGHTNTLEINKNEYRKKLLRWVDRCLAG